MSRPRFGQFGEAGLWVLVALGREPRNLIALLDEVRELDGRVRPGTFLGAITRLERFGLIEPTVNDDGRRAYRLTEHSGGAS